MIGMITLPNGDYIVLTDTGHLQSTNQILQDHGDMMLMMYKEEYSPAMGFFGEGFLHQLAQELGGTVEIEEKEGPPPGTIY